VTSRILRLEKTTPIRRTAVRETGVRRLHGDPIEGTPETPASSQHHRNEGYKRGPSLGPSYAERRSDLIFCQSGQIHRKMTNIKKSGRNAFIGDLFFVAAFDFRN